MMNYAGRIQGTCGLEGRLIGLRGPVQVSLSFYDTTTMSLSPTSEATILHFQKSVWIKEKKKILNKKWLKNI